MRYSPASSNEIRIEPLAQLSKQGAWQLELAHDRPEHLLLWITRGQGRILLNGARRGFGTHNAIFVPARHLMAVEIGRQTLGMALIVPDDGELSLPQTAQHLRVMDNNDQNRLAVILEALNREQADRHPLWRSAMQAHAELATIWLRRVMTGLDQPRQSAAQRLMQGYCARVVDRLGNGETMADHAGALDVTPTHLTRVCKAETGRTAAALLTDRQLHAARQLLTQTNVPVRDIARHLGFTSAAYFTRFIRQHCNASPTELRKKQVLPA
jgi:AraC family transcriptional regulator, transcriptional activator of pobA